MTRNRQRKLLIRTLMAATDENYTTVVRKYEESQEASAPPSESTSTSTSDNEGADHE